MTRYASQIIVGTDSTSKAAWNCTRDLRSNQGVCVFQLTGGNGGCDIVGTSGICCQWTVPDGVNSVLIEIWGAGGGGGAPVNCICCLAGGGGGGGAYARKFLPVTPGTAYTVCVGGGGVGGSPSSGGACCCGTKGGTTYVTGAGLSNFCAEGGYGGQSRCRPSGESMRSPNGGWPGTGGDVNIRGGDGGVRGSLTSNDWCNGFSYGGPAPFGGRTMYIGYDDCGRYNDWSGSGKWGSLCGFTGNFPGGGGTGGWPSCCCGICVCGGNGAPGLVRIWM